MQHMYLHEYMGRLHSMGLYSVHKISRRRLYRTQEYHILYRSKRKQITQAACPQLSVVNGAIGSRS